MPEDQPTPMPDSTPQPTPLPPPPAPVVPRAKAPLTGWRLAAVLIGLVAISLRLVMFLLLHFGGGGKPAVPAATALPTWPLKAGDVIPVKSGDPVIARWAESPDSDGFVVQEVERDGTPITDAKVCAMEPDYMADAAQPGGTLTLLSQDGTGDWRVHWQGGDTLPEAPLDPNQSAEQTKDQQNANCGKNAVVMMSLVQLHSWLNMQSGTVTDKSTGNDTLETEPVVPAKQ